MFNLQAILCLPSKQSKLRYCFQCLKNTDNFSL